MWRAIGAQPGLTTTVLDFTNDLWLLEVSFGVLIWLSVGLIVFMAIQDYLSQVTKPRAGTVSTPTDYRDAA
jgi:hypothetical protein